MPAELLEHKPVAALDLPFEFMLNALRLKDGFDQQHFSAHTGVSWETIRSAMQQLGERGLIESQGTWHRPTARGLQFLNDALLVFLPEKPSAPRFLALSTGS